jgi:hypothetical protein
MPAAEDLEGIHEYLKEHQPHLAGSAILEPHRVKEDMIEILHIRHEARNR